MKALSCHKQQVLSGTLAYLVQLNISYLNAFGQRPVSRCLDNPFCLDNGNSENKTPFPHVLAFEYNVQVLMAAGPLG